MDTVTDPLVGQVVDGRYEVVRRIAQGGMAVVYEAVDIRLDRTVALKVMHPWLAMDADLVARFGREAKSAARLSNPSIVSVHDQGRDGERVWLAMEYVPGRTLRDVLRERGHLQPAEALDVVIPVLEALSAAHEAGLVHRDIKPENVLVCPDGRIKVADFGLVRAVSTSSFTRTDGSVLGSVSYLAPELLERGVADERVDVYATGILLFELLTGSKPFEGETPIQVAYQHVHDDVPAPSVRAHGIPGPLDELVVRATRRDPDLRPRSAAPMLVEALAARRSLGPADEPTRPLSADERPVPGTRRPPLPHPSPYPRSGTGPVVAPSSSHRPEHTAVQHLTAPQPASKRRPSSRVRRRRALLAVLLVLVLAGGVAFVGWGPVRYTRAPEVAGLPVAEAVAQAERAGFSVSQEPAFSDTVDKGDVIASEPEPDAWVRKGGEVVLAVSRGPEMRTVPKVVGMTPAAAVAAIRKGRLEPGATRQAWSDAVAKGRVLATEPAVGKTIRHHSAVAIVVSKGPEPVPVPRLLELTTDEAGALLEPLRLGLEVEEVYSETVERGRIISQGTSAGKTLLPDQSVTVKVSLGPPLVEVPNVVGDTIDSAVATLEAAGFRVELSGVRIIGRVLFQGPGSGSAPKGSTIELTTT